MQEVHVYVWLRVWCECSTSARSHLPTIVGKLKGGRGGLTVGFHMVCMRFFLALPGHLVNFVFRVAEHSGSKRTKTKT